MALRDAVIADDPLPASSVMWLSGAGWPLSAGNPPHLKSAGAFGTCSAMLRGGGAASSTLGTATAGLGTGDGDGDGDDVGLNGEDEAALLEAHDRLLAQQSSLLASITQIKSMIESIEAEQSAVAASIPELEAENRALEENLQP